MKKTIIYVVMLNDDDGYPYIAYCNTKKLAEEIADEWSHIEPYPTEVLTIDVYGDNYDGKTIWGRWQDWDEPEFFTSKDLLMEDYIANEYWEYEWWDGREWICDTVTAWQIRVDDTKGCPEIMGTEFAPYLEPRAIAVHQFKSDEEE